MSIDWLKVARDVLMVLVIGVAGTVVLSALLPGLSQLALAASMLAVGFCISGCLTREGRLRHLLLVALGVWALRLVLGVITGAAKVESMLIGIVIVMASMGVGAVAATLVAPPRKPASPEA